MGGLKENQEITVPQVPLEVLVNQERMVPRVLREPRVTQVHQEMMGTKETKVIRERPDRRDSLVFRERRENQVLTEPKETRDLMETVNPTTTLLVTAILMSWSNTLKMDRPQNVLLTSSLYGLDTLLCSSKAMATDFLKILE